MSVATPTAENPFDAFVDQLGVTRAFCPVHRDAMGFPNTPCNHHIEPRHVAASNTTVANLSHASTGYLDPPVKINSPTVSSRYGSPGHTRLWVDETVRDLSQLLGLGRNSTIVNRLRGERDPVTQRHRLARNDEARSGVQ